MSLLDHGRSVALDQGPMMPNSSYREPWATMQSAHAEYSRLFGFQSKRKDCKKDQKINAKDGLRQRGFTTACTATQMQS